MNIKAFFMLPILVAFGMGFTRTLFGALPYMTSEPGGVFLMLVMVLSPFAYTPEMVPATMKAILYLNPLSYFVLTFQQLICYGTWPDLIPVIGSLMLGLGSFLCGFVVFQRAKYVFFDYA